MATDDGATNTGPSAILLDIEGTTTPISFVYGVLFPYIQTRLESFLRENAGNPEVAGTVAALKTEQAAERATDGEASKETAGVQNFGSVIPYVTSLMAQDRKSTALKQLQGQIWLQGYRRGEIRGEVFPDVPPALHRWHTRGFDIRIFSSGSVLAQRLLFSSTTEGDLTRFLNGYFDTTTGSKVEAASYARIAKSLSRSASEILFVSDVTPELDAAREAGVWTLLCVRPGNPVQPANGHNTISHFDQIKLDRFLQRE